MIALQILKHGGHRFLNPPIRDQIFRRREHATTKVGEGRLKPRSNLNGHRPVTVLVPEKDDQQRWIAGNTPCRENPGGKILDSRSRRLPGGEKIYVDSQRSPSAGGALRQVEPTTVVEHIPVV